MLLNGAWHVLGETLNVLRSIWQFLTDSSAAVSALSAALVAVFTFILWRATTKLWRASREQIKQTRRALQIAAASAKAAQKSADVSERALLSVERPRLYVENAHALWILDPARDGIPATGLHLSYRIVNYGRTPATLERQHWYVGLPSGFPNKYGTHLIVRTNEVVPDNAGGIPGTVAFTAEHWPAKAIESENGDVLIYGLIVYDDVWGNGYHKNHCFLFHNSGGILTMHGGAAGNNESQMKLVIYDEPPEC